jgi:hypothetical protein
MAWYFQPRSRAASTNCSGLGCRTFGSDGLLCRIAITAGVSRASRFGVGLGRVPERV